MKTKLSFIVKQIFFATVPPYDDQKKYRNRLLKYKVITETGGTSEYLFDIFDKASNDCKVEILFKSDQNQSNPIRSILLDFLTATSLSGKEDCFRKLAMRMYDVTDERNGMGLFVLIEGKKGAETRLMLSRFKGAQGLHSEGDVLKYLSQVFTKQNNHYKLAVFQDIPSKKSFWKGYAIDRQTAASSYKPFSFFWIEDFLQAETAITDSQGTSQLSKILKNVLRDTSDLNEKEQIISAVINLKSKPSGRISMKSFTDKYLSEELQSRFKNETNNDEFYSSEFGIDKDVLQKELGNTVLILEDGVTAFIPSFSYNKHVTELDTEKGEKKIKIEGILRDKKMNMGKDKKNKNLK